MSLALGLPALVQEQAGWEGELIVFVDAVGLYAGPGELQVGNEY
jgi:hypothetical protein